jgi:Carbohydrate esterase, sialic acid-specific acetylesterase
MNTLTKGVMTMYLSRIVSIMAVVALTSLSTANAAGSSTTLRTGRPLKVYILAGQSNMQGKAQPSTLPSMAKDPETKALYDKIVDADGKPRVQKNVILSYLTAAKNDPIRSNGPLCVGAGVFGPEVAFGFTMYEHLNEPIMIIKTAWGGKSLNTDFRPPSAGPFYKDPSKVQDHRGNKGIVTAASKIEAKAKAQHYYYNQMIEYVKTVLADLGKYHPAYDPKAGYEIAGFFWFQGFNDMLAGEDELYKATAGKPQYAEYSNLLAHFIRDVRKDLNAPKMPFVIGVLGIDGVTDGPFQKAQAAPAEMPEFKDNVAAVLTGNYWDKKLSELANRRGKKEALTDEELKYLEGASNAPFHYLGSAKIYSRIGEACAKALVELKKKKE